MIFPDLPWRLKALCDPTLHFTKKHTKTLGLAMYATAAYFDPVLHYLRLSCNKEIKKVGLVVDYEIR